MQLVLCNMLYILRTMWRVITPPSMAPPDIMLDRITCPSLDVKCMCRIAEGYGARIHHNIGYAKSQHLT